MAAESDGKKKAGTSRMGTCGKGIVFVACCAVSAAALAATVTLNGETTYNVASGTNTVSDTLTGSGSILKTGNGALNLTGEGNDFTGGTKVNAGAVLASALDALGTGAVEVAAKTAGVWFNVAPATTGGYTLFGNALDNAIEATEQLPDPDDRMIFLRVERQGAFARIFLENTCAGTVELVDGLPTTSKDDDRFHGFGLKSIQMIVDRLGGNMVITPAEGRFSLSILLPAGVPAVQAAH